MKKLLALVVLSLFLACLPTFAGAYLIQGIAAAPGAPSGTTVNFGTGSAPNSALLFGWNGTGVQLAVVDSDKLYQTLIKTVDPGCWDLTVLVGAGFFDTYTVKFWSTNTDGDWKLISGSQTLWTGSFSGSSSLNSAVNLTFANTGEQRYFSLVAVPEPASMVALLSGFVGFTGFALRRRK